MGGHDNAKMLPFLEAKVLPESRNFDEGKYRGASRIFALTKGVRNVPKLIAPSCSTIFSGVATTFLTTPASSINTTSLVSYHLAGGNYR